MPAVTSVKIGRMLPTYLFRKGCICYFRIAISIDVLQVLDVLKSTIRSRLMVCNRLMLRQVI